MLQPFMKSVIKKGELSAIVINGKVTHGVRKQAKFGDFRVQHEFGGTSESVDLSDEAIQLAEDAIQSCPYFPLYGRVDMVWDENNELVVSELELIEPELFFRNNPEAATLLAHTLADYTGKLNI